LTKTLLCGFQKCGNTYTRFVLFNYYNIKNNGATETLTWDELQKPHLLREEKGLNYFYTDGFPWIFHTHNAYDGQGLNVKYEGYPDYFKRFDKMIYIFRNPYDTMVSLWHWLMNRDSENYRLDLADFTREYLPKWLHHVKTTIGKADLILDYDHLRRFSLDFDRAIQLMDGFVDYEILDNAVKVSSFKNIREMSERVNQPYGLGGPNYRGYFCRNGKTGQYKDAMSKSLIEWIKTECEGLI